MNPKSSPSYKSDAAKFSANTSASDRFHRDLEVPCRSGRGLTADGDGSPWDWNRATSDKDAETKFAILAST